MTEDIDGPEVKILAVSNVYCRLMNFKKAGDVELGHYHEYDHGTLLAKGKVLVEKMNEDGSVIVGKIFTAPMFIFIGKNIRHRLTAKEDDTIMTCIHALRDMNDEIIDPSFIIDQTVLADNDSQVDINKGVYNVQEFFGRKNIKIKTLSVRTFDKPEDDNLSKK